MLVRKNIIGKKMANILQSCITVEEAIFVSNQKGLENLYFYLLIYFNNSILLK